MGGAATGWTGWFLGTLSLLLHLTTIITATIIAAITPMTIPTMAPPEIPPLSSSSFSGSLGASLLPGALVPEQIDKALSFYLHRTIKSVDFT